MKQQFKSFILLLINICLYYETFAISPLYKPLAQLGNSNLNFFYQNIAFFKFPTNQFFGRRKRSLSSLPSRLLSCELLDPSFL